MHKAHVFLLVNYLIVHFIRCLVVFEMLEVMQYLYHVLSVRLYLGIDYQLHG